MEDAHIVCDIPSKPDHALVAIFDGHGGSGAAIYSAANLVNILQETEEWKRYVEAGVEDVEKLGAAFAKCFITTDAHLREHQKSGNSDSSGCTAVCAIVTPQHIICSNAGDSRCVMGTAGMTKPLSDDHKPNNEMERRRIDRAGGTVQWKRVDGDLAVSRAFGDFQYKTRPDLPPEEQKVTCSPDLTIHQRTPEDDILILACDGVWDVLGSEEAVNLAREVLQGGEDNMQRVAEEIVDTALNKGSRDNISAVVVQLPGAIIGPASGGGVAARRAKREEAAAAAEAKH